VTYNALISACEKGQQWERALDTFADMKQAGVQPDVVTFSALVR
jgi:pentatricopeptide repeat protein